MDDTQFLAKNIRALREYYHETQSDLGKDLGVNYRTVSSYERGRTVPDEGMIRKIAEHFMMSVEELLNTDFSRVPPETFEIRAMFGKVGEVCPIIEIENVDRNSSFQRAVEMHKRLFSYVSKMDMTQAGLATECIRMYKESCREGYCVDEAVANSTGLVLLVNCLSKTVPYLMDIKPATLVSRLSPYERSVMDHGGRSRYEFNMRRLFRMCDDEKEIKRNIRKLQCSEHFSDLGNYFMALRLMWCNYDNDRKWELNRFGGYLLMEYLSDLENDFAIRFLKI